MAGSNANRIRVFARGRGNWNPDTARYLRRDQRGRILRGVNGSVLRAASDAARATSALVRGIAKLFSTGSRRIFRRTNESELSSTVKSLNNVARVSVLGSTYDQIHCVTRRGNV